MGALSEMLLNIADHDSGFVLLKCVGTLALNMVIKAPITGFYRLYKQSFVTMEDAMDAAEGDEEKAKKMMCEDDDVERYRRAHMNDLENVPIFILIAMFYLASNPSPFWANCHLITFTASRCLHTVAYVGLKSSGLRGLAFLLGTMTMMSMITQLISL